MKKIWFAFVLAMMSLPVCGQGASAKWYEKLKFSGYGMLQYQAEDRYEGRHNEFNLRLMRGILDGRNGDFDWRVQLQGTNARGAGEPTVQLIDLYAEWARYQSVRVRVGQFKRAFTFENLTHPITQGWYAYAHVINALSGLGDRTGEKSSGGRDIGLQVQGDVLQLAGGRSLLHYQVGIYNGEGVNLKDKNEGKDFIGSLWVMPLAGVRIGASGWTGSRGGMTDPVTGQTVNVAKNRYAVSVEYNRDEYTFRAEYVHSQGYGAERVGSNVIDYVKGDKADGWYAFGIVPVIRGKLHAKARYQTYRDNKAWGHSKTMYEVGLNCFFTKDLQLNLEYARVNDRSIANPDKHNYHFFDAQLDFRF